MKPIHRNPEPDFFEECVRFICGSLGGAISGLIFLIHGGITDHSWWCIGISAGVCSLLAVRFGDAF